MRTINFGERKTCVLVRREVVLIENYHWLNEETIGQFWELLENVYMGVVTNEEAEARKHQFMPLKLHTHKKTCSSHYLTVVI